MIRPLLVGSFGLSVCPCCKRGNGKLRELAQLDHFQVIADLMGSRNGQRGRLSDLFQVIARDAACEEDELGMDGNLDAAQRFVAGRAQRALERVRLDPRSFRLSVKS